VNSRGSSFFGAGGECGASVDDSGNVEFVAVVDYRRDIKGHLAGIKVNDATLKTEAQLIFAKVGNILT
jgi:hypothetical protein